MRLRIEHERATRVCFEPQLSPDGAQVLLRFKVEPQLLENWCWAALAASIGHFYGTGVWQQANIAQSLLRGAEPDRNRAARLDEALRHVGSFSHWSLGKPSFERIAHEILSGRPICLRISWFSGGAHYAAVVGIGPDDRSLHVEDPQYGSCIALYRDFPRKYRQRGGIWSETFWTCPDGETQRKGDVP